ncbi:uncharacterized protein BDCG_01804 [Blastomyces dermatitidis ER-3]|uniref:Uncharacterized protein n=1 Tax=Ajellomyces dermatitidis (strain ER-3 / ATCC MYA-2586) TaxID=559297 RepID=A0ABP2ESF7_AJEDR|nr:uncharacterized protein BDCG_01804 [Blastomyces dermatitidis ER-3]EEQ86684.2 hypothetical protein BDCG_01804 [Blastomyces dermatitidis ER-3]
MQSAYGLKLVSFSGTSIHVERTLKCFREMSGYPTSDTPIRQIGVLEFCIVNGLVGWVYKVKGDAEFLEYHPSGIKIDITALASMTEQQATIVKAIIAEQEPHLLEHQVGKPLQRIARARPLAAIMRFRATIRELRPECS